MLALVPEKYKIDLISSELDNIVDLDEIFSPIQCRNIITQTNKNSDISKHASVI